MFVWSDLDAVPLINIARMRDIGVPSDLAIIGYDNSPVSALPLVGLTSVDQNPVQLARTATQMLLERIDDGRREPDMSWSSPMSNIAVVRDMTPANTS